MKQKISTKGLRTWIEIDTNALGHNFKIFRKQIAPNTKLMSVVKSNAYGHGLVEFSREMERLGADWLGVDSITEALRLRKEKIKIPILVLGHTLKDRIAEAAAKNISVTVSNWDILKACSLLSGFAKKKIKFHIKIDTGMGRQGFIPDEIDKVCVFIKKYNLAKSFEGLYTHFAQAKNPSFPSATLIQMKEFNKVRAALALYGNKPILHTAATSGAILFPETHCDMVRIGIGMYGLWPSKEVKLFYESRARLKPILSWKTIIGEVRRLKKGDGVGYDHTECLYRNSILAVCPVGYWHGYPRVLSSIGHALVRGRIARVIGRVSMDMLVLDITDIANVSSGDEVVLIGCQKKRLISADDMADISDTINYEIVTRINPLIHRIYL